MAYTLNITKSQKDWLFSDEGLKTCGLRVFSSPDCPISREIARQYGVKIFYVPNKMSDITPPKQLNLSEGDINNFKSIFMKRSLWCMQEYKVIIINQDIVMNKHKLNLQPKDLEFIILHEIGHIAKNTSNEEVADQYAVTTLANKLHGPNAKKQAEEIRDRCYEKTYAKFYLHGEAIKDITTIYSRAGSTGMEYKHRQAIVEKRLRDLENKAKQLKKDIK